MREVDLYEPIIHLFKGTDVYPEVVVGRLRSDIVVRDNELITVIEMKTNLSLALIEQAYHWVGRCDQVYVDIPQPKRKINQFAVRLLTDKGIGVITVSRGTARILRQAQQYPKQYVTPWDKYLKEFYKENEAGGTCGTYMTPYKNMIRHVKEYLEMSEEPQSIREIVEWVDGEHGGIVSEHYADPHGSLRTALTEFETKWCRRQVLGGRVFFSKKVE